MTPNIEQIVTQVKALPSEDKHALWDALKEELRDEQQAARIEAVRRIQGKYKDLMSSSDEFLALKREEVELEERRYEERQRRLSEAA